MVNISEKVTQFSDMGREKLEVVASVLEQAPQGFFLEVGTRMGGTAILALDAPNCNTLISIDPYGSKPYQDPREANMLAPFVYPDQMYLSTMQRLYSHALEVNKNFVHFKIPSQEYIKHDIKMWFDGFEYDKSNTKFAYVLLDGEHNDETVKLEIDFFSKHMIDKGILLVDNIDWLTLDFSSWNSSRADMAYKIF